ncbi:MAG: hypothetical protein ACJ70T_04180, partial [Nitrososphaera sp.]
METDNNFMQCRTCDVTYCVFCGKRIATVVTRQHHGIRKCTKATSSRESPPLIHKNRMLTR